MAKLNSITKLTDNKFLNLYETNFTNEVTSKDFNYFIASRRKQEELACVTKDHSKCDAVMIVPVTNSGELYLIKQYRPAIGDYILECPAGLVDPNENIINTASRELFEETGLKATEMVQMLPACYTSAGMSDETVAIYVANVTGSEPTTENKEENEDIEIVKFSPEDFVDIVNGKHGLVAIKTALIINSLSVVNMLEALVADLKAIAEVAAKEENK